MPDPSTPPSIWHQILVRIARKPKFAAGDSERTTLLPQHEDFDEKDERGLTSFLLKFGEGLEEVSEARLFISAFTIGASYFFGGLIPLVSLWIGLGRPRPHNLTLDIGLVDTLLFHRVGHHCTLLVHWYHFHCLAAVWRIQDILHWSRGGHQRVHVRMFEYACGRRICCRRRVCHRQGTARGGSLEPFMREYSCCIAVKSVVLEYLAELSEVRYFGRTATPLARELYDYTCN